MECHVCVRTRVTSPKLPVFNEICLGVETNSLRENVTFGSLRFTIGESGATPLEIGRLYYATDTRCRHVVSLVVTPCIYAMAGLK